MSPELELQGTIYQRLKTDPTVASLVNTRVFDRIPEGAAFPYISFNTMDSITDDFDCIEGYALSIQVDCWSRSDTTPGYPEVHRMADAVRQALVHEAPPIELAVNALAIFNHSITRVFRDPDGLTSHAVVTFEAVVERK